MATLLLKTVYCMKVIGKMIGEMGRAASGIGTVQAIKVIGKRGRGRERERILFKMGRGLPALLLRIRWMV